MLSAASFNIMAGEEEIKEVYVQMNPEVQIVLTNAPCNFFSVPTDVKLNLAYAHNINTGDKVTGCFSHEGDTIQIELIDPETKSLFSYRIKADNFQPRPGL